MKYNAWCIHVENVTRRITKGWPPTPILSFRECPTLYFASDICVRLSSSQFTRLVIAYFLLSVPSRSCQHKKPQHTTRQTLNRCYQFTTWHLADRWSHSLGASTIFIDLPPKNLRASIFVINMIWRFHNPQGKHACCAFFVCEHETQIREALIVNWVKSFKKLIIILLLLRFKSHSETVAILWIELSHQNNDANASIRRAVSL